jgi:hypothetical protein
LYNCGTKDKLKEKLGSLLADRLQADSEAEWLLNKNSKHSVRMTFMIRILPGLAKLNQLGKNHPKPFLEAQCFLVRSTFIEKFETTAS